VEKSIVDAVRLYVGPAESSARARRSIGIAASGLELVVPRAGEVRAVELLQNYQL
jgi:hypothetical protein